MEEPLVGLKKASNTATVNHKEGLCVQTRVGAAHSCIKDNYCDLHQVWWYSDTASIVSGVHTHVVVLGGCGIGLPPALNTEQQGTAKSCV